MTDRERGLERSGGSCRFCLHAAAAQTTEAVIAASDRFVAWPSVGSLVEGWVLVVPRAHHLSLAAMPVDEFAELRLLLSHVTRKLERLFPGDVYTFEHGASVPGSAVGCSIDHAHLHLVPLQFDLAKAALKYETRFTWRSGLALPAVAKELAPAESYLWLSDPQGATITTVGDDLPSQFFRRVIASRLHAGDYDWRRDSRTDVAARTIAKFARSVTRAPALIGDPA